MIKILPQHVANQIAAGEVVQRPASVVKELLENSVDAGATSITLITQDGGRALIQVIDNGDGLSPSDALAAFKRHATSKISTAEDLFNLHTFGFRGEALASIASVSEIELKTARAEDSLGTEVTINGGSQPKQLSVSQAKGTSITVRNLFFNTPARRKFLKSDTTENRQIITEFQRVAMVNPEIEFSLIMDGREVMVLHSGNVHQRIVAFTNKTHGTRLLPIESITPFAKISGYVGTPDAARKRGTDLYFFVNGRYMRNPYLQKAVTTGYGKLLAADQYPAFYIYIEVDPAKLDVNIHPTKSEVKFEDEHAIWQTLNSSVRQVLGQHNIVPVLDFDNRTNVEIPAYDKSYRVTAPLASIPKEGYDPFKSYDTSHWESPHSSSSGERNAEKIPFIEQIPDYLKFDENSKPIIQSPLSPREIVEELPMKIETAFSSLQWGKRYIITTTADEILIIDYPRAMQRIAYEKILTNDHFSSHSQGELHPETIELSAIDHRLLIESEEEVADLGFNITDMGGNTVALHAMPVELTGKLSPEEAIESLIEGLGKPTAENRKEKIAKSITKNIGRITPRILSPSEMQSLISDLLASDEPSYTPDQLPIIEIINPKDIFKR